MVLDANVLVPASLRDLLLRTAEAGLFVPFWSPDVLTEVHRTLVDNRMTSIDAATRLIVAMQRTFPDATSIADSTLSDRLTNDPKDRHVLAAAISTGSSLIVTFNVRHFHERDLDPHHVTAMTPDAFLQHLLHDHIDQFVVILEQQAAGLRQRPMTVDDILRRLDRHAPSFAQLMRTRITRAH